MKVVGWCLGCVMLLACSKGEVVSDGDLVPKDFAWQLARRLRPVIFDTVWGASIVQWPERRPESVITIPDGNAVPALHVVNFANDSGYLVLSADWKHEPLCAFVPKGKFRQDTVPPSLLQWLAVTIENIELIRSGAIQNRERAARAWKDLVQTTALPDSLLPKFFPGEISTNCNQNSYYSNTTIGPLLPVEWGQKCSFNELCPPASCTSVCSEHGRAPTGCVATALSQLIRYWQYPASYQYGLMPPSMGNNPVQELMRAAGQSVQTNYQCSGSSAPVQSIVPALKSFFRYGSARQQQYDVAAHSLVRSNLDRRWPVLLSGSASKKKILFWSSYSDTHLWVCDGYSYTESGCFSYLFFHMNWGWNEIAAGNVNHNGWFAVNQWNPAGRMYQYAREMVYDIRP